MTLPIGWQRLPAIQLLALKTAVLALLGRTSLTCSRCSKLTAKAIICAKCALSTCLACAHVTEKQLPLSLLNNGTTCRSLRLPVTTDNDDALRRRFMLLSLADASAALTAPTDNQRNTVRAYCRGAETVALHPLPANLDTLLIYVQHRLHIDKVDTSTLELDLNALSAWHISAAQALRRPSLQNPVKDATVRYETKILNKKLKKKARPMMKWSMAELTDMINSCPNTAVGWHDRVCLGALSLAMLRKGAAAAIRLVRTDPKNPLSFDTEKSDIIITTHPELGEYIRLAIHTDKNAVPGRPRYAFIPAFTKVGINLVRDIKFYLTKYPVPDGYMFAAPYNKHGRTFRSTPYTQWDAVVHRCYARAFPNGKKIVASHSCRKSVIQAIFNTGLPEGIIGDVVGWLSVKSTVLKYYASLSIDHALSIVACLCDLVTSSDTTSTVAPPP